MLVSMLCWGSWANTQKIDKRWRFELFCWDYIWGLLACALLFGSTLGNTNLRRRIVFSAISRLQVSAVFWKFFSAVSFLTSETCSS